MLRVAITTLVVLAASAAAVSVRLRPVALQATVPLPDLQVHLRTSPYGVDDYIAPKP
jgi:hypothetical protein